MESAQPQEGEAQTPETLLGALRETQEQIEQTAKIHASAGGGFRLKQLRKYLDAGLQTAEDLMSHADADEQQLREARSAKSQFLYRGWQYGWEGFDERLTAHRDQLRESHADSGELAMVDAMLLQCAYVANDEAQFTQVMAALKAHADQFPGQLTGLALYRSYAERLKGQGRTAELQQCCGAALDAFGRLPQADALRRMLTSAAREQQAKRANQAHAAQLKSALGGRDGYFVLYAHPKKEVAFMPVNYHVSDSLDAATTYVSNLKEGWVWELERWFPKTEIGRRGAYALCSKLIKDNTISIPMSQ